MNEEQRKEFYRLCAMIVAERDQQKFEALLDQLNQLLEKTDPCKGTNGTR